MSLDNEPIEKLMENLLFTVLRPLGKPSTIEGYEVLLRVHICY